MSEPAADPLPVLRLLEIPFQQTAGPGEGGPGQLTPPQSHNIIYGQFNYAHFLISCTHAPPRTCTIIRGFTNPHLQTRGGCG